MTKVHTHFQTSQDGTKKYLFPVSDGKFIEAAFIPDKNRNTLCVSTQIGCKMACEFCATGKQGFQGQLSANEILNQIKSLPESDILTNFVFMGMGEPLDNIDELLKVLEILTSDYGYAMSPKRITVSTIGIKKELRRFLEESKCHLALSIHNPFEDERLSIMPVQKTNKLSSVIDIIKEYDFSGQRRFSVEYIMFKDYNDQVRHAKELGRILRGIESRINLIRFHKIPGSNLEGTSNENIELFKTELEKQRILTTVRRSRGLDIDAACGLLSTKIKSA